MQAIAEEVVSTSGGGAKYITSGFSAYNGHTAIGFYYSGSSIYIGHGTIDSQGRIKGDAYLLDTISNSNSMWLDAAIVL